MLPTTAAAPPHTPQTVESLRAELAALGGRDTLLAFEDSADGVLDLASAHPSGLATFLAGRSTRLSSLFREPGALATARRSAASVRRMASRLTDEHGLPGSHLAVGIVTRPATDGRPALTAPVLLAPVSLRPRGAGEADHDIDLRGPAAVNPSLTRLLGAMGVHFNPEELLALASGGHGFTPRPALQRLRALTGSVPGLTVLDRTVIGTFVDLGAGLVGALDAAAPALEEHPVARALIRSRGEPRPRAHPNWTRRVDDVWGLPLDPSQRAALDAVRAGSDVAVVAPAGTGSTQLAAQLVVEAAGADLSVLVVAPRRAALDDLRARLDDAGVGSLAAEDAAHADPDDPYDSDHSDDSDDSAYPDDLHSADDGSARRQALAVALRTAEDLQVQAVASRRALREVRSPWATSKLEVLRQLRVPFATPSRPLMSSPTLSRLAGQGRVRAAGLLSEAIALGVGLPETAQAPWSGADLHDDAQTAAALAAVRRLLRDTLPHARAEMRRVAVESGLGAATSVTGWARHLDLLVDVRDTLDVFVPAVFESPLEEMVAATATSQWRERHGVSMSPMRRRAWRLQARDLERPGSRSADLHAALLQVQTQRTAWQQMSTGGGWPRVPSGLPSADDACRRVRDDLDSLDPVLTTSTVGGGLVQLPLAALEERLKLLDGDAATLADLPRRAVVHEALKELGLLDVLAHLRAGPARRRTDEGVAAELEQLWSLAVLEAMDAQDADLHADPAAVREAWRRVADLWAASLRRRSSVPSAPTATIATALALPHRVPTSQRFDVVLLLDAGSFGVAEATLALVRAPQVVVIGDPWAPRPARAGEPEGRAGEQEGRAGESAFRADLLAAARSVLPTRFLERRHRSTRELLDLAYGSERANGAEPTLAVPAPDPSAVARLDLVPDGVVPVSAGGDPGKEPPSPDAEVARVVQLALEHARDRPGESLAVVAVTRLHARRVAGALRRELAGHPGLAGWFGGAHRPAFVVTDLAGADAAARDHVVLTLGLGLTQHRRVLHRFGVLDSPEGERLLRRALACAGQRLTVVSSLAADQLDPYRTTTPGAVALRELLTRLAVPAAPDTPTTTPDPVLTLLVEALARRGVAAAAPSGPPVRTPDLSVGAAGGPVAVLWDGRPPPDVNVAVLADEEELEVALKRVGWRVARVSARDVVADPDAAARDVLEA